MAHGSEGPAVHPKTLPVTLASPARRPPCPTLRPPPPTTITLQYSVASRARGENARARELRTGASRLVSPSSPHLEWVLCYLFCRLYFAATSGVCLIRSGAAGFQKKLLQSHKKKWLQGSIYLVRFQNRKRVNK